MPFDDPNPKFERALAQHLRGGSAQANCPDAETLAAYHERNLALEEMARWKEHISACEACQEALALVETTENQLAENRDEREVPVFEETSMAGAHAGNIPKRSAKTAVSAAPRAAVTPVRISRRRPPLLRWAIPLGAVAAGVLVFIGIYEQRAPKLNRFSNAEVARNQAPNAPGPIVDRLASKLEQRSEPKDEGVLSAEMSGQKSERSLPAVQPAKPVAKAKDSGDEVRQSRDQFVGGRLEKKTLSPPAPAPSLSRKASTDTAVSQNEPVIAAVPPAGPPPAPAASGGSAGGVATRPPARADLKNAPPAASQTVTVESAAPPIDTTSSMMLKQGYNGRNVTSLTTLRSGSEFILSPDNKVWWKLGPGGTVELTTDGGKKWKSLDTGAISQLTAGAAPSSKVCWIAGKAGTLVLTRDRGSHWARISTPITADLGGVHAADAKHASIWDAANQISYETFNGGATWNQTSGK
jgi:hypothetical protein